MLIVTISNWCMTSRALKAATAQSPLSGGSATFGKHFKVVVYDDFSATPLQVTFLNDEWWVTAPGIQLQPLKDYFGDKDIRFIYLCEAGGKVGALALARMLGKTLENPVDRVDECLRNRVAELKRLGVELNVKDEKLTLELRVFPNEGRTSRQGKYSMWCHLAGNFCEMLFDVDGFGSKKNAEQWVVCYFDLLSELGIIYNIV